MNLKNVISNYDINNWPDFVSFNFEDWDERDVCDLNSALPTITFTKLLPSEKGHNYLKIFRLENSKILSLLLKNLISQNVELVDCGRIRWTKFHLKGWPVGVSDHSSSRKFGRSEMLKIFRGIDKINFVPILPGEKRTITFTDGEKTTLINMRKRTQKDYEI